MSEDKKQDKGSAGTKQKAKVRKAETGQASAVSIKISDIWSDGNVRDEGWEKKVADLKALIEAQGLLQPIGVKKEGGPNGEPFKLIFGARRLEACKQLDWARIDAKIASSKMTRMEFFFWRVGENSGRKDLTPMEEAKAFRTAIDEYGATAKDLAKGFGKSDGYISQRLQLLKLPEEVQTAVEKGTITASHAREIARVTDEDEQKKLLAKAEKMPAQDFREHVAELAEDKKKQSNRGRKAKEEPAEKTGVRSEAEAVKMLGGLDAKMKTAKENDDAVKQSYYKGCIRGIMWARRMGGTANL